MTPKIYKDIEEFKGEYYTAIDTLTQIVHMNHESIHSINDWLDSLPDYEIVFGNDLKIRRVAFYVNEYYSPIEFDLENGGILQVNYCSDTGEHESFALAGTDEVKMKLIEAVLVKFPKVEKPGSIRKLEDYTVVEEVA